LTRFSQFGVKQYNLTCRPSNSRFGKQTGKCEIFYLPCSLEMMNRKKYATFVSVPAYIKRQLCILNTFSKICPGSNCPMPQITLASPILFSSQTVQPVLAYAYKLL